MYETKPNASVGAERTPKRKNRKKMDRLTRDAIAAQEAGMSYGKWKVLHPHTPDEDDEEEMAIDPDSVVATCECCGEQFVKPRKNKVKRFCSTACQNRHNTKKRKEKARQKAIGRPATCPICGTDFLANYQHRIYCGSECFAEGQRRRSKDRAAKLETDLDNVVATCEHCGEKFAKSKRWASKRFCSTRCRKKFNDRKMAEIRKREANERTATCAICGAAFTPANGHSKYCSRLCYADAHNRKNREWYARNKEKQKEAAENGSV